MYSKGFFMSKKVKLDLVVKNSRSCDGCTKCCEGWLSAEIHGEMMYPGKPCQFVEIGKGCTAYETRPENPCKQFMCMWRATDQIPEHFSPKETGIVVAEQRIGNIPYLAAIFAGSEIQPEMLSWFVSYGVGKQLNLEWTVNGRPYHLGHVEFIQAMSKRYSNNA